MSYNLNTVLNTLTDTPKYREVCLAYYSVLTYTYTSEDSYKALHLYIEKSDLIYSKFKSWSYIDSIHLSSLFITYLEIFVGLRWCIKNIFIGDSKHKQKSLFQEDHFKDWYEALERSLPIVDKIFWYLRNEIHHSYLRPLQPEAWAVYGGGRERAEEKSGLFLPMPTAVPKQYENSIEQFFQSATVLEGHKYVPFIYGLEHHHKILLPFHDAILNSLAKFSEQQFGRPIRFSIGTPIFAYG